jgi:hypothetical protein
MQALTNMDVTGPVRRTCPPSARILLNAGGETRLDRCGASAPAGPRGRRNARGDLWTKDAGIAAVCVIREGGPKGGPRIDPGWTCGDPEGDPTMSGRQEAEKTPRFVFESIGETRQIEARSAHPRPRPRPSGSTAAPQSDSTPQIEYRRTASMRPFRSDDWSVRGHRAKQRGVIGEKSRIPAAECRVARFLRHALRIAKVTETLLTRFHRSSPGSSEKCRDSARRVGKRLQARRIVASNPGAGDRRRWLVQDAVCGRSTTSASARTRPLTDLGSRRSDVRASRHLLHSLALVFVSRSARNSTVHLRAGRHACPSRAPRVSLMRRPIVHGRAEWRWPEPGRGEAQITGFRAPSAGAAPATLFRTQAFTRDTPRRPNGSLRSALTPPRPEATMHRSWTPVRSRRGQRLLRPDRSEMCS